MNKHIKPVSLLICAVMMFVSVFSIPFTSFAANSYIKGIDVSENNSEIDFNALKAEGYDFVMIRLGYFNHLDKKLYEHIQAACDAGMMYGLYLYSCAFDSKEAQTEADFTIQTIKSIDKMYLSNFVLPVAYDVEYDKIAEHLDRTQITDNALLYCNTIKNSGYVPMIYSNLYWFNNYIDVNTIASNGIKLWYANYVDDPDFASVKEIGDTKIKSDMWQYTDEGIDQNILYHYGEYKNISSATIKLSYTSAAYSGKALKPTVTVKAGNKTLKKSTDYTIAYSNNTNAGKATVTITGKGLYYGSVTKTFTIQSKKLAAKNVKATLSATTYTYNGKAKKPSVKVIDSDGKKIASKYYTIKYSNNKNVGTASVKITFKGNYSGSITKKFTIKPKASSVTKLTAGKKKFTVKWKKQTSQVSGYQIQYATNSKFTQNKKTVTVNKSKTTSKTISKLKAKKKYYVRVRTYKTVNGKKIYSAWSKAKTVTTKK